jgi:hypothetical protein
MSKYYKIGWFIFAQTISILLGVGIVKSCYSPEVTFVYVKIYNMLQEFADFIQNQPEEVRKLVEPNTFIMSINVDKTFSYIYMGLMLFLFAVSEVLCIVLIHLILSYLKQHIQVFSENTYRLHMQLTASLAFQVSTKLLKLANFFIAMYTIHSRSFTRIGCSYRCVCRQIFQ